MKVLVAILAMILMMDTALCHRRRFFHKRPCHKPRPEEESEEQSEEQSEPHGNKHPWKKKNKCKHGKRYKPKVNVSSNQNYFRGRANNSNMNMSNGGYKNIQANKMYKKKPKTRMTPMGGMNDGKKRQRYHW